MREDIRNRINRVSRYLARRDIGALTKEALRRQCGREKADVVIALGSDLPQLADASCEAYARGLADTLLFCGGVGHSTENLRRKAARILSCDAGLLPESEAEIYAFLARERYHVPENAILLETHSTNTMENLKFGKKILQENQIPQETVLLMQDPLLQQRSHVTALDFFEGEACLLSYAPFLPVMDAEEKISPEYEDLWDKTRFLELLLGEMWRLRDDEHGYGPRGKGFLRHVDIPEDILEEYETLLRELPEYTGRCV